MDAVIYCRVSSAKQVEVGDGIAGQEHNCRKFAENNKLTVIKTFKEEGVSGSTTSRPALQDMISFLKKHKGLTVIVDDLKRFSRDVYGYWATKEILTKCDARLMSTKQAYNDNAEGRFFETLAVATGQLEREQNAKVVFDRMKSRIERGYWPFPTRLPGYVFIKEPAHGKVLRRQEPQATTIAEALEGYASGRFETQTDVMQFLKVTKVDRARGILDHALLYAGYLEYRPWKVSITKGHHDALISYDTYQRIQKKLEANTIHYEVRTHRPEFPLKGYIYCECGAKLRAGFSKGRNKSYPYYQCNKKGCPVYGKSIKPEAIEGEFKDLLKKITPTKAMLEFSTANLHGLWLDRLNDLDALQTRLKREYDDATEQIEKLAMRSAQTTSETAAKAYESQMDKLEKEKVRIQEEIHSYVTSNLDFRTALDSVSEYLSNPLKRWEEGNVESRRNLMKMCFDTNIVYDRKHGFRTNTISLTYALITGKKELKQPTDISSGHGGN